MARDLTTRHATGTQYLRPKEQNASVRLGQEFVLGELDFLPPTPAGFSTPHLEPTATSGATPGNASTEPTSATGALPDLVFDNVEIEGDRIANGAEYGPNFRPGDEVRLDWAVDNRGSGDAGASRVAIWLRSAVDGMRVDTNSTDAIRAGGSDTGQFDSFVIPSTLSPGLCTIELIADDQRAVAESNESNNSYRILIRVEAGGEPDLVLDNVQIQGSSIANGAEYGPNFKPGDEVRLDWAVDNRGTGDAGSSRVAIWLRSAVDGMMVDTNATAEIGAGDSDTGQFDGFTIPSTLSPGLYTVELIADDQNVIRESNEGNNSHRIMIRVDPAPASGDEVRQGTDTTYNLPIDELRTGTIDAEPIAGDGDVSDQQGGMIDKDWYKVTLEKGHNYYFGVSSVSMTTDKVAISLYRDNTTVLVPVVEGSAPYFTFDTSNQTNATQIYYLAVSAGGPAPTWRTATGDYALIVQLADRSPPNVDDYRDDRADTATPLGYITKDKTSTGVIGQADADDTSSDKDVFEVHLQANQTYKIALSAQSLESALFTIRDHNFVTIETSSIGRVVSEIFVPEYTGLFYLRVGPGAVSEQGSYSISFSEVSSGISDDYPDYLGDTSSRLDILSLPSGLSHAGKIESIGDKDVFSFNVTKGHSYQLSVTNDGSTVGALNSLFATVRSGDNFNDIVTRGEGVGVLALRFEADGDGVVHLRIGSGGSGEATGGYRLTVVDRGITQSVPESAGGSALQDGRNWLASIVSDLSLPTIKYVLSNAWDDFAPIIARMDTAEAAIFAKEYSKAMGRLLFGVSLVDISLKVDSAPEHEKLNTLFVEIADSVAGAVAVRIGTGVGGAIGVVTAPTTLGMSIPAGMVAGGLTGAAVYVGAVREHIRSAADWVFDKLVSPIFGKAEVPGSNSIQALAAGTAGAPILDEGAAVKFDEIWYLEQYPEVAIGLKTGAFSSAYAHFLAVGIDLGYQPNPGQRISRQDLALEISNNDPNAVRGTAVFTTNLAQHAGDGLNYFELSIANQIVLERLPGSTIVLDSRLGAVASRKAMDLHGYGEEPELGRIASVLDWSNGNSFSQQFQEYFEELFGGLRSLEHLRVFVGISGASVSEVMSVLRSQAGFAETLANPVMNTMGVAEYAGRWVVIFASGADGYAAATPVQETLSLTINYGDGDANLLYSGTRDASLHGFAGNDTMYGGPGSDSMNGGAGNDALYLFSVFPAAPASGTVTLQPGPEGQDLWVTNVYYDGGLDDDALRIGGWADTYKGLIRFDLAAAGVPAGVTSVTSATMRLYNTGYNNGSPTAIFVDTVNTAWTETYRWSQYPLDYTNLTQIGPPALGWVEIDVTAAVNGWLANPGSNFGLQLRPASNSNNFVFFVSSDATDAAAANRPQLVLTWGGTTPPAATEADIGIGGPGDDTFIIDSALDQVIEAAGEGRDTVRASASYVLVAGAEVEVLTAHDLAGVEALDLTGNEFGQTLIGNAGSNVLDGGAGADTMLGGAGDDTYFIDNLRDRATEASATGGNDHVLSLVSFQIATNVERLTLIGTGHINGFGNTLDNTIAGNSGNNLLGGGAGVDTMSGGLGNDIYEVDNVADGTTERTGEGTDTVRSSVNWILGANIEHLTLIGGVSITGTGNDLANNLTGNGAANVLTGGGGNDRLDGASGADTMAGGLGDDTYVADGLDTLVEQAGEGSDTVISGQTYRLKDNFEILTLSGVLNVAGYGNAANNVLNGNPGNNQLDGGAGADSMFGGRGNDIYIVDNAGDRATEVYVDGGTDLVISYISFSIAGNVENLNLIGSGATTGIGNGLANVINGNNAANLLVGGLGADTLNGGLGNDTYLYRSAAESSAAAMDRIFVSSADKIDLSQIDADPVAAGNNAFAFIGAAAFSGTAGELRAYGSGSAWFVEADVNGDSIADLVIDVTTAGQPLIAANFVV